MVGIAAVPGVRSRRAWKVVAVVLAVVLVALSLQALVTVRQFRQLPRRSIVERTFANESPFNIAARYLMFLRGSPQYMAALRSFVYVDGVPNDVPWNRWLLERDIFAMSAEDRAEFLPLYPLVPSLRFIPFIQALLDAGGVNVLPLVRRLPDSEGVPLLDTWVDRQLVRQHDVDVFLKTMPYLTHVRLARHPIDTLLQSYWEELDATDQGCLLVEMTDSIPDDSPVAEVLLTWSETTLRDVRSVDTPWAGFLGKLGNTPARRTRALDIIAPRLDSRDIGLDAHVIRAFASHIPEDERPALWQYAVGKYRVTHPTVPLEILHSVIDQDVVAGESLAKPFLEPPDSSLRKGLIVLLARHDSQVGLALLDESFSGQAPRLTFFVRPDEFIRSKAARDYIALAGHDYEETGKTWPPSGHRTTADPIAAWRGFIERYPWFPGTDDAYYRLAFEQYYAGRLDEVGTTITEYLGRNLPDQDADPYLMYIVRRIALETTSSGNETDLLARVRAVALSPIAAAILENADLTAALEALQWFEEHPRNIRALNTDIEAVQILTQAIRAVASSDTTVTKLQQVRRLLESQRPLFAFVMYSQPFPPARSVSSVVGLRPDIADLVEERFMAYLSSQLAGQSDEAVAESDLRRELTMLVLLEFESSGSIGINRNQSVYADVAKLTLPWLPGSLRFAHERLQERYRGSKP